MAELENKVAIISGKVLDLEQKSSKLTDASDKLDKFLDKYVELKQDYYEKVHDFSRFKEQINERASILKTLFPNKLYVVRTRLVLAICASLIFLLIPWAILIQTDNIKLVTVGEEGSALLINSVPVKSPQYSNALTNYTIIFPLGDDIVKSTSQDVISLTFSESINMCGTRGDFNVTVRGICANNKYSKFCHYEVFKSLNCDKPNQFNTIYFQNPYNFDLYGGVELSDCEVDQEQLTMRCSDGGSFSLLRLSDIYQKLVNNIINSSTFYSTISVPKIFSNSNFLAAVGTTGIIFSLIPFLLSSGSLIISKITNKDVYSKPIELVVPRKHEEFDWPSSDDAIFTKINTEELINIRNTINKVLREMKSELNSPINSPSIDVMEAKHP